MKSKYPIMLDIQSETLWDSTLRILSHYPAYIDIAIFPIHRFKYAQINLPKDNLLNSEPKTLLLESAHQQGLFAPYESHTAYFVTHEHIYDETLSTFDTFFFDPSQSKNKSRLIINELFLPLAFFTLQKDCAPFLVIIDNFVCYFKDAQIMRFYPLAPNQTKEELLAYFQHLYNIPLEQIYTFEQNIDSTHQKSSKQRYIGELCTQTTAIPPQELKAFLAFAYFESYNAYHFPNFLPKTHKLTKPLLSLGISASLIFTFIIPLLLYIQNQNLQSQIAQLNEQSQNLFTNQANASSPQTHTFAILQKENTALKNEAHFLFEWQKSYAKRYEFMNTLFAHFTDSKPQLEQIDFSFTPKLFLASIEVSSDSQIEVSSLLVSLNTTKQKAYISSSSMQSAPSFRESLESSQEVSISPRLHSNIILIHNVL